MTKKNNDCILVVGGAGYIGSHQVDYLLQQGYQVVVLDNLSCGHRQAVSNRATFFVGDMGDASLLSDIFTRYQISAVMHFAAFSLVGESVGNPSAYYQNNVSKTLCLLDAMRMAGVQNFIFSSTAAVFGNAEYLPIDAAHPKKPINPYGKSKLMVEQILADYAAAYGMRYAILRYFNACGADPQARLGELHNPETHLIPIALQTAQGKRDKLYIFGDDYNTVDGTCCRDYVHICDLATAHLLALEKIQREDKSIEYNLGNGNGFTVRQVVDMVLKVSGADFTVEFAPRREGDSDSLIADSTAAIQSLGWQPQYSSLETIIKHAWQWEQNRQFNP